MEKLLEYDRWLFQKINSVWTHPWLDQFLPAITDLHQQMIFVVLALSLLVFWVWRQRAVAVKWMVVLALAIGVSDAFSYRVIKKNVERNRPQEAGVQVVLRSPKHSGKSFPSNHSSNVFAAATILSTAVPQFKVVFFVIAAIVGYSRIYVGVHFPLDVIGGALIGWSVARLMRALLRRWASRERSLS